MLNEAGIRCHNYSTNPSSWESYSVIFPFLKKMEIVIIFDIEVQWSISLYNYKTRFLHSRSVCQNYAVQSSHSNWNITANSTTQFRENYFYSVVSSLFFLYFCCK